MTYLKSTPPRMAFEAFVEWARHQDTKHEFIDGVPVAMAGGGAPVINNGRDK